MTNMIHQTDPYLEIYAAEKRLDPNKRIVLRAFQKRQVEGVDWLNGQIGLTRDKVETSEDWSAISKILEFWTRLWPNEWEEYVQSMQEIKGTRARSDGYSREQGRNGVRYLGALPPRLMRLIKVYFPYQQWDREFVDKFTNNIRISKVGEKIDTWFTLPDAPFKRVTTEELIEKAVQSIKKENKIKKKHGNTNTNTNSS